MNPVHVLLTGASGTVGREVLLQLLEKGDYRISVYDRDNPFLRNLSADGFEFIAGDISRKDDLEKIPGGIDAVIHLAALIPPLADEKPELTRKVNVEGTRLLVNHIETHSPQALFIYSSSVSVYGDRVKNPHIRVTDPTLISEGDLYGQSKLDAEAIFQNSRLKWSIFRLAAIMKNHKISRLMFHMPLDTGFEICTPEDTARAFVNALEKPDQIAHQIFNLGGGKEASTTYREFLERSFEIYGLGKLNFPEKAFADHNYHCGYMADGDRLEEILRFRRDTLETYFQKLSESVSGLIRFITRLLSPFIKWGLLLQSEPYRAYKSRNPALMQRFFANRK